jgi:hypothetical protein
MKIFRKIRKYSNPIFWWELKYEIKCFFNPKQKWLTDLVPNTFCDKTGLIPKILFACIVDYVEVEREQDHVHEIGYDWSEELENGLMSLDSVDKIKRRDAQIMEVYGWAKSGREYFQERIDAAYPPSQSWDEMFKRTGDLDNSYELIPSKERTECYKRVNELEEILAENDKKYLKIIIDLVPELWT